MYASEEFVARKQRNFKNTFISVVSTFSQRDWSIPLCSFLKNNHFPDCEWIRVRGNGIFLYVKKPLFCFDSYSQKSRSGAAFAELLPPAHHQKQKDQIIDPPPFGSMISISISFPNTPSNCATQRHQIYIRKCC